MEPHVMVPRDLISKSIPTYRTNNDRQQSACISRFLPRHSRTLRRLLLYGAKSTKSVWMNFLSALCSFLFFLILQIVPIRSSFATTIVVLKTQSEIVAGADSMGVYLTGNKRISNSFCKIHQINDFFIASAGFYDTRAGQSLNIKEVVTRAARKSDPLTIAVNRSSSAIASALSQAVSDAREDDGLYNVLVNGNVVTFFFGFEDGKPATYAHRFSVMTQPEHSKLPLIDATHEGCGPQCVPADGNPYLMHTRSEALDNFRSQNLGLLRDDPVAFVRSMIFSDIAANNDRSGLPVDILRIDQNGPKWIEKKPNCP